jgi:histidine triad (HIT) family protein
MYNHAPPDYDCPLCAWVRGESEHGWNELDDIVLRNEAVLAFVSPVWWPNNAGPVIVIPLAHHENIFDLPDEFACAVHSATRRIALAFKATYGCDGVSTRQHNAAPTRRSCARVPQQRLADRDGGPWLLR